MEQPSQAVLLERRGRVALVTLNRPDVINAINTDVRTGIMRLIAEIEQDSELVVTVVAGAGQRGFCGGADIKDVRMSTEDRAEAAMAFSEKRSPRFIGR